MNNRASMAIGAFVCVLMTASGCNATPAPATSGAPGATGAPAQLTVLAASSLSGSLADLSAAWTKTHPTTDPVTSTGATSALRTQIEQGSPADVLLGADTSNAQALVDEGDAIAPVTTYATNVLTVIVPSSNPKNVKSVADLAKPGVCVIAAGRDVPINKYAEQLVANLAARPDYGAAFEQAYEANICSREDNVGAVVNKVSLAEGDAAIVYVTDAQSGENLATIPVPADSNVVATYGAVAVKASVNATAAAGFVTWLRGSDAQSVFKAHGFGAAP